jgi:hypothetical protein
MSNQSNNNLYHLLPPAQQLNYFQPPLMVPHYPPSSQQQYQFIQQQQTQTQEPKKARKQRAKKCEEERVEVVPIEIACPNIKHQNHHLHQFLDKMELTKIVGWGTTVTKDKLIKGFPIECIINDTITNAIIDRSVIYTIAKSEVNFF